MRFPPILDLCSDANLQPSPFRSKGKGALYAVPQSIRGSSESWSMTTSRLYHSVHCRLDLASYQC